MIYGKVKGNEYRSNRMGANVSHPLFIYGICIWDKEEVRVMPRQKKKAADVVVEHTENSDEVLQHKKRAFLAAYEECGNISQSARAAGISRQTHYDWLRDDEFYKAAFDEADQVAGDALEAAARERALAGSDTLLIFLLKGIKPEKYKDRVEQSGGLNNTFTDLTKMSPEDRRARIDELNRKRGIGASEAT